MQGQDHWKILYVNGVFIDEKMKKAFDWNSCIDNWTTPECWLIFQKWTVFFRV